MVVLVVVLVMEGGVRRHCRHRRKSATGVETTKRAFLLRILLFRTMFEFHHFPPPFLLFPLSRPRFFPLGLLMVTLGYREISIINRYNRKL